MAKKFESLDEAVRNAIDRVTAGVPEARKGESARNRMKEMSNRNVEAGVWREGEECILPDEETLDASCVVAPIVDGNEAAAVGLKTKDGKGKLLFFSSLKKSVVPYDNELRVAGDAIQSDTPLADTARAAGTLDAVYEACIRANAGKTLRVKFVRKVQTARFVDGMPQRPRNTTVPFFEIVETVAAS